MKLTFKEIVNREIDREYEVWKGKYLEIVKYKDGWVAIKDSYASCDKHAFIKPNELFTLEREEVSLDEALEAFEEGKEIESVASGYKYIKEGERVCTRDANSICIDTTTEDETLFMLTEIKGKWYIND